MKKWNRQINIKKLPVVLVVLACLVFAILMYGKVSELTNQLTYLQDTTNIILSDVGGMQSSIEKTLEEEASMVEDYSIKVTDMDFYREVYDVEVSVIPKEFTDSTTMSIYFGTTECKLKSNGYVFEGSITLPLNKTFDGNVTFLLANGKKKTTEVVEDFSGMSGKFDQILTGTLEGTPSLKDNRLSLKGKCSYTLNNADLYSFSSFKLIAEIGDEEIWSQDLLQEELQKEAEEKEGKQDQNLITTEQESETAIDSEIDAASGTANCKMAYEFPDENVDSTQEATGTVETQSLRIYLQAVTTEGYRFETDLLKESLVREDETLRLDKESLDTTSERVVYDRRDHKLSID